jgi:hypothetical protein
VTPEQRYEAKVDRLTTPDGCHPWIAGRTAGRRYGIFTGELGQVVYAHRWAWEHYVGPIPEGQECLHGCDNPLCQRIHPNHVHIGTQQDNVDEMFSRNRQPPRHGEANSRSKLTELEVRSIRERYAKGDISQRELAQTYGVHHSAIYRIIHHKRWDYL